MDERARVVDLETVIHLGQKRYAFLELLQLLKVEKDRQQSSQSLFIDLESFKRLIEDTSTTIQSWMNQVLRERRMGVWWEAGNRGA